MNDTITRLLIAVTAFASVTLIFKLYVAFIRKRLKSIVINSSDKTKTNTPTLLYFWTPECSQCKWQEQNIKQAAEELDSAGKTLTVKKINAHSEHEFTSKFNIITVPTLVLIDADGKIVSWNPGLIQKKKIIDLLSLSSN